MREIGHWFYGRLPGPFIIMTSQNADIKRDITLCKKKYVLFQDFLIKLGLEPGQRVLDLGCGTGGSAFFMARHYGVSVHGIDLSTNMINIAKDRLSREEKSIQEKVWNLQTASTLPKLLF